MGFAELWRGPGEIKCSDAPETDFSLQLANTDGFLQHSPSWCAPKCRHLLARGIDLSPSISWVFHRVSELCPPGRSVLMRQAGDALAEQGRVNYSPVVTPPSLHTSRTPQVPELPPGMSSGK